MRREARRLELESRSLLLKGRVRSGWNALLRAFSSEAELEAEYGDARERPFRALAGDARLQARLLAALDAAAARPGRPVEALAWRGALRRRAGDASGAAEDLREAERRGLELAAIRSWRGEARLQLGERGGLRDLSAALELPCRAWNHAWLGRAKVSMLGRADGLRDLERACALEPRNAWLLGWRGEARRRLGRPGAREDLRRALELEPSGRYAPFVRTWLGHALLEAGQGEKALAEFDGALAVLEDYGLAWSGRAAALRSLGRRQDWLSALDAAAALSPKLVERLLVAPREELLSLRRDAARAARERPRSGAARRWSGLFARGLRRGAAARTAWDQAVRLEPAQPLAWAWRGRLRTELGDHDGADADLSRALRLAPSSPEALGWRAAARAAGGRLEEALSDLDRAVRLDPFSVRLLSQRGTVRLMAGDAGRAAEDLEEVRRRGLADVSTLADLSAAKGRLAGGSFDARAWSRAARLDAEGAARRRELWTRWFEGSARP